jgi:hypothetical protein
MDKWELDNYHPGILLKDIESWFVVWEVVGSNPRS